MAMPQEARKIVIRLTQNCELKAFIVTTKSLVEWNFVSLPVFYSYNNSESKDISRV